MLEDTEGLAEVGETLGMPLYDYGVLPAVGYGAGRGAVSRAVSPVYVGGRTRYAAKAISRTRPELEPPHVPRPRSRRERAPRLDRRTTRGAPLPLVLRCPRCGRSVAVLPSTAAWRLPCGRRMRPIRPTGAS